MCIFNYLAVILIGPGKVIESGETDIKCTKCGKEKVYGTHHCSVCNKCVPMMDHHCMWTNQCIGQSNRKIFISLLFWGSMGCYWFTTIVNHSNYESYCLSNKYSKDEGNKYLKFVQTSKIFQTIIRVEDLSPNQTEML